ncbi:MAG: 2TM domain-containing protein [Saprospiraceae bacterium]
MNENISSRDREIIAAEAQKRVNKIKKFYKNLASWAGTSFFLLALDLFMNHRITWSKFPVFFWGIAIAMQLFEIIRLHYMDNDWEEKMVKKQIDRQSNSTLNQQETPDYTNDLLRDQSQQEKEVADLTKLRKVKKAWRDEDLV